MSLSATTLLADDLKPRVLFPLKLEKPLEPGRPKHLGAASGLVRIQSRNFIIGDDETNLVEYDDSGKVSGIYPIPLERLPIDKKPRKKKKPDFESLFFLNEKQWAPSGALVAFPSFSTDVRTVAAVFPFDGKRLGDAKVFSLASLLSKFQALTPKPNIEGSFVLNDSLLLFQRANGKGAEGGIFRISFTDPAGFFKNGGQAVSPSFTRVVVGDIEGVPLGINDAFPLSDSLVLALTAAEASKDAVVDGKIVGAALALIRLGRNGAGQPSADAKILARFSGTTKYEGLSVEDLGTSLRLDLVDDADDPDITSSLSTVDVAKSLLQF